MNTKPRKSTKVRVKELSAPELLRAERTVLREMDQNSARLRAVQSSQRTPLGYRITLPSNAGKGLPAC